MRPIPIASFARAAEGVLAADRNLSVAGFATDSRQARPGDLFLAIRGGRVDGHEFVADAIARGAVAALVERPVDAPHVRVDDVTEAIARFGRSERARFAGPVIGVTGSAGKTTTKELLAAALSPIGPVLKSEGNRNTEYTSPLLWAELDETARAVVVEMAMRGFGQIAHLAEIARPTIGVVTNIGHAHLLQVGSREGIARAKGELLRALPPEGVAVLWNEDEYLGTLRGDAGSRSVRTFGFDGGADCRIVRYRAVDWESAEVEGTLDGARWHARIPAAGRHLALSAAAAVLAATAAGLDPEQAAGALAGATLPPMRMEVRRLGDAVIVLDTYNASPASTLGALDTVAELAPPGHRRAVIGEMRELGDHGEEEHRRIGRAVAESMDEALFYGGPAAAAREEALAAGMSPERARIAESLADVREFLLASRPGDAVLVKGSRALELERALEGLC